MSLRTAFNALRKNGYVAEQNFTCCQTCGWAELTDEQAKKAVFYHRQDNADKVKKLPFHLSWAGNGVEICKILTDNNVQVEWCGSDSKRIKVIKW